MRLLKILFTLFLFSSTILCVYGQRTIKGRVIDENLDKLPASRVYNADMLQLGEIDSEGFFEVSVPTESDKLIFGFLGYEFANVSIPANCNYLEVILLYRGTYHYRSNRKVDRLRKKDFDKLPELRKKAVEKGLFKMDSPCYTREFIPDKPQLDQIGKELRAKRKVNKRYFKDLAVGDTIRIPYSVSNGSDRTGRTTLIYYSYVVDGNQFDCIIEGVIVDKNRGYNGYNIIYKVTDTGQCKYASIIHEERDMKKGEVFRYNMKYFKVITE
ncbi:hypothetical protein FVR03_23925 [Pontibacter qinzhouensis]|uniref:Carboxypeptidase-like regulatory domain-containing protein n=1 Tax=Pontibacter qinzhouensis TaxID=2603253 RepID=A0A5C8IGG7_9BACT|nr:hypothetical protein [Pontibacter qinzhouensis]TXK20943.1 hypothetical protein FVR03_23925 [Pontibacter qinzhouensis]